MNVFFYFGNPLKGEQTFYPFICLAEGFEELGVCCYADFDNCLKGVSLDYLIKHSNSFKMQEADIIFVHNEFYKNPNADNILLNLNKSPRNFITVFIDESDGVRTPGFNKGARSCDYVLKCHYNEKYNYPINFYPWQFGLCNRVLNAVSPLIYSERENQILVNFRAKHQLRDYVNDLIQPIFSKYMYWNTDYDAFSSKDLGGDDLLFWKQTGARHYPQYYKKLSMSSVCACYGGVFAIPIGNHNKYTAKIVREINDIFHVYEWDRVRQWDSWRLWEAWAAACCVIHIDLEKYGCVLPVMPENDKHYIGIDIKNINKLKTLLARDSERPKESSLLGEIAANGREFVLENYAPKKVAERLLTMVGF
ncbi:glycosyltransferase [Parabacteroides timonensis]|uniref:glycosyltransferase n=1 Tax=Parabacteroides timonensis TaxID=1871013 RepID=UPI00094F3004|nr:glycosyltransferase [Parabacteroides timonensis]